MLTLLLYLTCQILYSASEITKSNIILILSDDQDIWLKGLKPMSKLKILLQNEGTTFINAFTSTPLCCPSRSSILTGKYMHNHYVVNNSFSGGCSGDNWQQQFEPKTFATYLQNVGYKTFYSGKYLNQYGKEPNESKYRVPKGWDNWIGLIGNSVYYNYTLNINGKRKHFKKSYLTKVIDSYAQSFLKAQNNNEPFLMVIAPPAPHAPFTPEYKYKYLFNNTKIPRTSQFNNGSENKHWLVQMKPLPLPNQLLKKLDKTYADRWKTLMSVDDIVENIFKILIEKNLINNTYIIYTSDNGFHLGQFGLPIDKRQLYEFDIRIPFIIRGPHFKKAVIKSPIVNVDIAPTILEIAGVRHEMMDGISIFSSANTRNRIFPIEYQGEGSRKINDECPARDLSESQCNAWAFCKCQDARNNTYNCIRTLTKTFNYIHCKFEDDENFEEAYDLLTDPYQLKNIAYDTKYIHINNLMKAKVYTSLFKCKRQNCNRRFDM